MLSHDRRRTHARPGYRAGRSNRQRHRAVLGLLLAQIEHPGSAERKDLTFVLLAAAEDRHRQGDYGAAKLLDDWAQQVGEPTGGWGVKRRMSAWT